jgi:hypothetical protein
MLVVGKFSLHKSSAEERHVSCRSEYKNYFISFLSIEFISSKYNQAKII